MTPVALTIAGSDPSGGAGIQADLKTFHQFGVYGEAAITLLTVQNTQSVTHVELMPPGLVVQQIRAILDDIPPHAAKTGALGDEQIIRALGELAADFRFPLVVDPVMISKHGSHLMAEEGMGVFREILLPHAFLLTPNLHEAEILTGEPVRSVEQMCRAAEQIRGMGARHVLVKGGHLQGPAIDVLLTGDEFHELQSERIETRHTHGTGCTYSAAITAELAKGTPVLQAVESAKKFITRAIRTNPGLGAGAGPVNHHARIN